MFADVRMYSMTDFNSGWLTNQQTCRTSTGDSVYKKNQHTVQTTWNNYWDDK